MNLTNNRIQLIGFVFSISLLIPPNIGLNYYGLNFEDVPLVILFFYLFSDKLKTVKVGNLKKYDFYFGLFLIFFVIYTNLLTNDFKLFNQTNLRMYFYFFLAFLIAENIESESVVKFFEPLSIVMFANFIVSVLQIDVNGNLNGWILNNTSGTNFLNSGRLGGLQGGGPNVIGIICSICGIVFLYKILSKKNLKESLKSKFLNYNILLLSVFNLYLTYSRGSYIAFGIGSIIIILLSSKLKNKTKLNLTVSLVVLSTTFLYLNSSIILKQTNRGFLTELAINNVELFKGKGGGNYVKEVYKEYLITLDEEELKNIFNITYSDKFKEKDIASTSQEDLITKGYLKLDFDYRDGYLPRSLISFYFSDNGVTWEKIGYDHTNGELINLIPNDSYFEVGGWGDGTSSDDSQLTALIKEVKIITNDKKESYKFPKYKRGIDYYVLTPILRNVYRGNVIINNYGIELERPRGYWLALPNKIDLSKKDFEIIVNLELEGIPKGNETIFSQSSILRLNEEFNDQSWKWSIIDGRMYFFWVENVDNGYSKFLGGKSLRSGKLISNNEKFDTLNIPEFDISQYDEITTSHNGFLTMSVEYGVFPVSVILLACAFLIIKNFHRKQQLELVLFLMLFIQNLTNDLVYSPDVAIYFWIFPMIFLFRHSKNL